MVYMGYCCVVDVVTMGRRWVKNRALLVQRFMMLVLYLDYGIIVMMLAQLQHERVFH